MHLSSKDFKGRATTAGYCDIRIDRFSFGFGSSTYLDLRADATTRNFLGRSRLGT